MDHPLNNLLWLEELLPPEYECVPKFGGMAYYMDMKFVLLLVENPDGEREHKGIEYPFEIWKGAIFPIEYKKQSAFFLKFDFLENHPANRDWLYVPMDTENFEDDVKQVMKEIIKRNPLIGTPVKFKKPKDENVETPVKKKSAKKPKADKKRENAFIASMIRKKIK